VFELHGDVMLLVKFGEGRKMRMYNCKSVNVNRFWKFG